MFHAVCVKFSVDDLFPTLPDHTFSEQWKPLVNLQTNCACHKTFAHKVLVQSKSSSIEQQPGTVYPRFLTMAATLSDDEPS